MKVKVIQWTVVNISLAQWHAFSFVADKRCDDTFQLNSQCYRVHKNERVDWFTAANRCQSNNGSLAVFDDNVRQYFPSSLMAEQAWIGLVKSWWTWPDLGMWHLDRSTFTARQHAERSNRYALDFRLSARPSVHLSVCHIKVHFQQKQIVRLSLYGRSWTPFSTSKVIGKFGKILHT